MILLVFIGKIAHKVLPLSTKSKTNIVQRAKCNFKGVRFEMKAALNDQLAHLIPGLRFGLRRVSSVAMTTGDPQSYP